MGSYFIAYSFFQLTWYFFKVFMLILESIFDNSNIWSLWCSKSVVHYFCWLSFMRLVSWFGIFAVPVAVVMVFAQILLDQIGPWNEVCFPLGRFMIDSNRSRGCSQPETFLGSLWGISILSVFSIQCLYWHLPPLQP